MPSQLIDINVWEVTLCAVGANKPAKVALFKSMDVEGNKDKESNMEQKEIDAITAKIEDKNLKSLVDHLQKSQEELTKQLEGKDKLQAEFDTLKASVDESIAKKEEEDAAEKALNDLPPLVKEALAKQEAETEALRKKADEQEALLAKFEKEQKDAEMVKIVSKYPRTFPNEEEQDTAAKSLSGMSQEQRDFAEGSWVKSEKMAGQAESFLFDEVGSRSALEGSAANKIENLAMDLMAKDDKLSIAAARVAVRDSNPDLKKAEHEEGKGD